MPNYLDDSTVPMDKELVLDTKSQTIYDPRYFTQFQKLKYAPVFDKMRPDLGRDASYEWTEKFLRAEEVINELVQLQARNYETFVTRFGDRYRDMIAETAEQLRTLNETKLQINMGVRVGSYEEVQMKVNFYDKIMDKVRGYDMLYPLDESTFKSLAQLKSVEVRERQKAVKDRLLREMGVDYSLLK